jgi:hypothetical protein
MSHLAFFICALCMSQLFTRQYAHSLTFLSSLVLVPHLAPTLAFSFMLSQPTAVAPSQASVQPSLKFPIPTPEPKVMSLLLSRNLRASTSYTLVPSSSRTRTSSLTASRTRTASLTASRTRTPSRTPSRSPICIEIMGSYNYLMQDRFIPIALNPPKPDLPNRPDLYDGFNRTDSNDPATYPEFERILRPLNTMNTFMKYTNPDCDVYARAVLNKWAAKRALTGRVNSYGVLLHRIAVGNMALSAINTNIYRNANIKSWQKTLLANMIKWPEPYDNNFRMWEYRAIALTSFITYTPFRQIQTQLNTFLDNNINNGILTCELRGMKSLEYHSYFLTPMMDTMYILKDEYRFGPPQASAIEAVIEMLESYNYARLEQLTGKKQVPISSTLIERHRARWNCLRRNINCFDTFFPLSLMLEFRAH